MGAIWAAAIVAHIADVATTRHALTHIDGIEEVNPIAGFLWEHFGTAGLLALKAAPIYWTWTQCDGPLDREACGVYLLIMGAAPALNNVGELLSAEAF